jgi:hypothetical protein
MKLHRMRATRPILSRRRRGRLSGLGATETQAQFQTEAVYAEQEAVATGIAPVISDTEGTVVITGTTPTGISQQVTASNALSTANLAIATDIAEDAYAIQAMHANATLAANATPFLASGVVDGGGKGAPPAYKTLPTYPANNPGKAKFPYPNPAPHWTTNAKWWTGQTLLNVGVPSYNNDPIEYLRSALVDSNMTMFKNWVDWYLQAAGMTPGTVYASAQPWAEALQDFDFAQYKFIMTSEGPVYLPFSYADLTAMQTTTKPFEYGYEAATLATYLAQWVSDVLPNVAQFPISSRLNPSTSGTSPYPSNHLPAIYRQGTTVLASIAPYLPVLTIVLAGGLAAVLAPASGVASAAADTASDAADVTSDASGAVLSAGTDDALSTVGTDAIDAAGETLPEVTVTAAPVVAAAPTTALSVAAAAGATLPEITVSSTPLQPTPSTPTTAAPIATTALDYPDTGNLSSGGEDNTNVSSSPTESSGTVSDLLKAGGLLSKLLGGNAGSLSTGSSGNGGMTGVTGDTLGDFLGNLSANQWLLILALGAAGFYFLHESKGHARSHA